MPETQPDTRPARPAPNSHLTPEERSTLARLAVNTRWSREPDRAAATAAARAARDAGYYAGADAAGVTDPDQREAMAAAARRAEMDRMRAIQQRNRRRRAARALAAGQAATGTGEAV